MSCYERFESLVASAIDFLQEGLDAQEAAIVIVRPDRRSLLEAEFERRGTNVAGLCRDGRLHLLHPSDALATFMVDGVPDEERFRRTMGGLVDDVAEGGRRVRVFGEAVVLLWDEGNVAAALAVEELWNELADERSLTIMCGYPLSTFRSEDCTTAFRQMCDRHSTVIPAESSATHGQVDPARAIATLQQQLLAASSAREEWHTTRDELRTQLRDRDEASRLRDQFVATLVHDLRTPAALVSTALALLRDTIPERSRDLDELLETALAGSARIERLISDVLEAARIQAGSFSYELRELDMGEVVERAVRDLRISTSRVIKFIQQDGLGYVLADEYRQLQILDNLVSNAVKFSEDDTVVEVELTGSSEWLTVHVRDQGVGIALEDQTALFQPFTRLSQSEVPGTGLGLSTAKALVEGQGGSIWFHSEPAVGSVFSYTIPLAQDR